MGNHLGLWQPVCRILAIRVERRAGAAAAQDEVNSAVGRIEVAIGGFVDDDRVSAGGDLLSRPCSHPDQRFVCAVDATRHMCVTPSAARLILGQ
jgi:hypothetical protein